MVETFLLRLGTFSWIVTRDSHQTISQFPTFRRIFNFTSLIYQLISHINPDIHEKLQAWTFLMCTKIIYVCSRSSNSTTKTWYLFMDCDTWLTSKKFSIPNLGRGPPGRGPRPTSSEPLLYVISMHRMYSGIVSCHFLRFPSGLQFIACITHLSPPHRRHGWNIQGSLLLLKFACNLIFRHFET